VEENPTDLVRYKGRMMEDPETAVDELLGEGAGPAARNLPVGADPAVRRVSAREALGTLGPSELPNPQGAAAAAEAMRRMEDSDAAAGQQNEGDTGQLGVTLRRARVELPETDTPQGMNRIPAPSGGLAITGQGTGGAPVSTAQPRPPAQPSRPVFVNPGQPGGTVPVQIQPQQPAQTIQPAQPGTGSPGQPIPPSTETTY
jgi:hypothetical protein